MCVLHEYLLRRLEYLFMAVVSCFRDVISCELVRRGVRRGRGQRQWRSRARMDTIRYDTRRYFNVRSKADISQLNLPHGTDN